MGALSFYRAARKVVGLTPLPEFPSLEALLEAEAGEPHDDYRVLARVLPPSTIVVGIAAFVPAFLGMGWLWAVPGLGCFALAGGLWYLFDRLDRSIPRSKARIRKLAEQIWERYSRFSNVVGIEPALSQSVAPILDEAAGIYLKQSTKHGPREKARSEAHARAVVALEDAMARMLELAEPETVRAQELELAAGWAEPLLNEMKDIDRALDQHLVAPLGSHASASDPLAGLRDARLDLQTIESAIDELDQRQSR